jgi:spore coat protein D
MFIRCKPIVAPTQYRVRNQYVARPQPIIHPVVHVDRINVVNVPKPVYKPIYRREIVDPWKC